MSDLNELNNSDSVTNNQSQQVAVTPNAVQLADLNAFISYLNKFVPTLLDVNQVFNNGFISCMNEKFNSDLIRKFISEPQIRSLIIQKFVMNEDLNQDDHATQYFVTLEIHYTNPKCYSVQILKRGVIIENDKPFASQTRIISLIDQSPYETLHSYVSNTLAPYFKSYIKRGSPETSSTNETTMSPGSAIKDQFISIMEKRIDDVEVGLLHLQQNIEIPDVNLDINPIVVQLVKKCAEDSRRPKFDDFDIYLEDAVFLNHLQTNINRWITDIKNITKLDRDPASGTTLQEINFWNNLEKASNKIIEKRDSIEVSTSLDILKHAKRFIATVSFDSAIKTLKETAELARDYNSLLKDLPLSDLISSNDLTKMANSIQALFNHFKKIRNSKYPLNRLFKLIEAVSKDLATQLLKILHGQRLMMISYDDFEKIYKSSLIVFNTWDDEYERLQGYLRDIFKRKREDAKIMWRINTMHKKLQTRLNQLFNFRYQHEQLCHVIDRVLKPSINQENNDNLNSPNLGDNLQRRRSFGLDVADATAIEEVSNAYEKVKETDVLDVTDNGQEEWETSIKKYEEKIERVESRMTTRLRDQLGTAKNANEMFRIFAKFNALLVRPHVRGAIREYQTQLIRRVKVDIEALQEKFKQHYAQSKCARMSRVRDIPPVAGTIIWTKQLERQLNLYMKRVEAVLGKGWETHVDGQKLKADGDSFRQKLSTQELFEDWSHKVTQKNIPFTSRIFTVDNVKTSVGNVYSLKVNFSPDTISLTKEVRNMKWLVPRVHFHIANKAHSAKQIYPFAVSLLDNVSTYKKICEQINTKPECQLLVAGMKKEIQALIMEMSSLAWDSFKLEVNIQKFSDVLFNFREKVDIMFTVDNQIELKLKELNTCPYKKQEFNTILNDIQKSIDYLSLKGYSNLSQWVQRLENEIEKKLATRLHIAILVWINTILNLNKQNKHDEDDDDDHNHQINLPKIDLIQIDDYINRTDLDSVNILIKLNGDEPIIKQITLEILIRNQVLYVAPSTEDAREHIITQLTEYASVLTTQKRLQHSRYQVSIDTNESEHKMNYTNLITNYQTGLKLLEHALVSISRLVDDAKRYINEWLQFQSIWDLQPDRLYSRLGSDLKLWISCLNGMKESRKSFDTLETQRMFGPLRVDYTKVQSKVSIKYDAWHKDVLSKFGTMLNNDVRNFYRECSKSRSELENKSIEAANSSSDAVNIITYVQSLKRNLSSMTHKVEDYKIAESILIKQRYQFPKEWVYTDQIDGEWSAFNEILTRKDKSIQAQVTVLQTKLVAEEKAVEMRSNELITDWDTYKPIDEKLKPSDALKMLQQYELKFNSIKDEQIKMSRAKNALDLKETKSDVNDPKVVISLEELTDLKEVWFELDKIYTQIDALREKQWLTIQPRQLRANLDDLLKQMKEMPSKLRSYESYNYVKQKLQDYLKMNLLIVELKSEALKERHWKLLMKKMRIIWNLNDLSLGTVWDTNLLVYDSVIKDALAVAQGEKALEEFMRQVSELWKQYTLELVNYQNKCQIIKGWDDLFNKLREHLSSVSAMKLSPYYKQFEEEASSWEDKLNRINAVFDVWIDVQRRWVYLDGIFGGSADIKHLLPNETQKFQSVSSEFLSLMKKVVKSPLVLDILNIQGVLKLLERLADLLAKLQKALGEYLERERASCARFYFVGDEDLLEMIGNTNNISRLQKHFKKMFAGVHTILLNDEADLILGVSSKEGEELKFEKPISIKENPKINTWLRLIEKEIRYNLALLLQQSVVELKQLKTNLIENKDKYLEWVNKYQAQLVVLTSQISWTELVEQALASGQLNQLENGLKSVDELLNMLADSVLVDQPVIKRRKLEHLIIEHVHQRNVIRDLINNKVSSVKSFDWLCQMRFYFDAFKSDLNEQLLIKMANAEFKYGFEYLGVQDKLVQTPLTDRCYLTMSQALEARLGGSPFGPAGTGKTESVKALGCQLGQFVLVFNCDETFDFQAMGRIFVGLCQVGAWGCFDEFNRLEERMLSAVSQQIQTIQEALKEKLVSSDQKNPIVIELIGKQVTINPNIAIFITMNPGYAGRSNLPDNLKKLFRSLAMTQPDNVLIAQVMLYSQGFRTAEILAQKIVPFFKLCNEQLSSQSHYDFGLRSLKSVLVMAGNVKREKLQRLRELKRDENLNEQEILIQSIMESFVPRLISDDLPLLNSLLNDVFPGVKYQPIEMVKLKDEIKKVCKEMNLIYGDEKQGNQWLEKVMQIYSISNLNHGLMMVGPSGSGKSTAWKVLLKALSRLESNEGVGHVIDPKAITKDELYGSMDPNTREWSDGLFTHILRRILDNVRGELTKRQWIVFDGDVDPEWVENLNSVLDDNKLLTLPNGERLNIPPNVRIMFEVQDLKYATLATVSRCGMIWFSEHVLTLDIIYQNYLNK